MRNLGRKIKKIIEINPVSFSIKAEFDDGKVIMVPLAHIFAKPKGLALEIFRGGMFGKCFLESGALAWPNGLALCPDAMRMWADEQKSSLTKKTRRA